MKRSVIVLVVALVLVMVVGGPAAFANRVSPAAPDQTAQLERTECNEELEGEFVLNVIGDLSGPYALISQPLRLGLEHAAEFFNEEHNGICGADVVIELYDTGGSADRAQEFWDEVTSQDEKPEAVFMFSSADAELLRDQAMDLQIPILLAAGSELALYGESGDEPGYTFAIIPLYTDQLGAFCDYVAAEWDSFGIEGDPVIGHLSWDSAFGRGSDTEETRAYCESLGVGYAGAEYFSPATSDVSTQLMSLVNEGANIIYTTSLATGPANIAAAIAGAEMQDEILLAGTNWALDTSVIALGGPDTAGITGAMPFLWWDELENYGVQVVNNSWFVNLLEPAGDNEEAVNQALFNRNIAYVLSFPVIDAYIEMMTRAINEVGSENLNGEAVYNVLDGGFAYDAMDGIVKFEYDENTRAVVSSRIGQIAFVETDQGVNPTVLPLTDEFEKMPDLRVGGADTVE